MYNRNTIYQYYMKSFKLIKTIICSVVVVVVMFLKLTLSAEANIIKPIFIGPRENIPTSTPKEYGFWSFSIIDKNKISRSGQPLISEFKWLKNNGWKSIVDLRVDGEYKEIGDDRKLKGFKELKFNFLSLPIRDGSVPTTNQAKQFLKFVIDPKNQPVHVHCRGGYGRAGTMMALYRYTVDGWKMSDAITESRLYRGGVDDYQKKWLLNWEKNNKR